MPTINDYTKIKHFPLPCRWAAVTILHSYCAQTNCDYSEYIPRLVNGVVKLFTDKEDRVLHAAWDCLQAITKVGQHLNP